MAKRFVFRQVCSRDWGVFLNDGEIRSKNHHTPQLIHQTSHAGIVNTRGTSFVHMPHGGVVNDYVPFYFSPRTGFSYTISQGNIDLRSPTGQVLGKASEDERIFFVCDVDKFHGTNLNYCFSNVALNTAAPMPVIETDLGKLATHIDWTMFDDPPITAHIPEIGYAGVGKWFHSPASPQKYQNRSRQRMAEFLVKDAVPLDMVTCVIAKTPAMEQNLREQMASSNWNIPILVKPGCYFS